MSLCTRMFQEPSFHEHVSVRLLVHVYLYRKDFACSRMWLAESLSCTRMLRRISLAHTCLSATSRARVWGSAELSVRAVRFLVRFVYFPLRTYVAVDCLRVGFGVRLFATLRVICSMMI